MPAGFPEYLTQAFKQNEGRNFPLKVTAKLSIPKLREWTAYLKIRQHRASSPLSVFSHSIFSTHTDITPFLLGTPAPLLLTTPIFLIPSLRQASPIQHHGAIHHFAAPPNCSREWDRYILSSFQHSSQTVNSMGIFQNSCLYTVAGWQATAARHNFSLPTKLSAHAFHQLLCKAACKLHLINEESLFLVHVFLIYT